MMNRPIGMRCARGVWAVLCAGALPAAAVETRPALADVLRGKPAAPGRDARG